MLAMPAAISMQESAWGDVVPFAEYPQFDLQGGGTTVPMPFTTIDDRADGRCRPLYETEIDLSRQRALSRNLSAITPIKEAAFEQLKRHTFGEGITVKVSARKGQEVPAGVVERVQRLVDEFLDTNDVINGLDVELHDRSREDGEALGWLQWKRGKSRLTIPEPDQLTQPAESGALSDWLNSHLGIDCSAFVPSWSFGVLTDQADCSTPLAYYFAHDSGGRDWDIVPASEVVHIKRNVPRKAKRGVGDMITGVGDLAKEAKLATNMVTGAALQAAIAWIEELAPGTTQSQADGIGKTDLLGQKPTNIGNGGGWRPTKAQHYGAGSIIRPSAGRKYQPGPMGAERNSNFELAAKYILRRCGIRWSMPEYMISGDASNGNYASLLVAESPFVKARQADQKFYGSALRQLLWKAIDQAWRHGVLDAIGLSISELRQLLEVAVTFPEVATRDQKALAERLSIEKAQGWVSDQTAMTELGRDPDAERAQGAKPSVDKSAAVVNLNLGGDGKIPDPKPGQTLPDPKLDTPATDGPAVQSAALNGAQVTSLVDIVQQATQKAMPVESARAIILAAFPLLTPQQVDDILRPLRGFEPATEPAKQPEPVTKVAREPVKESDRQGLIASIKAALWGSYP